MEKNYSNLITGNIWQTLFHSGILSSCLALFASVIRMSVMFSLAWRHWNMLGNFWNIQIEARRILKANKKWRKSFITYRAKIKSNEPWTNHVAIISLRAYDDLHSPSRKRQVDLEIHSSAFAYPHCGAPLLYFCCSFLNNDRRWYCGWTSNNQMTKNNVILTFTKFTSFPSPPHTYHKYSLTKPLKEIYHLFVVSCARRNELIRCCSR